MVFSSRVMLAGIGCTAIGFWWTVDGMTDGPMNELVGGLVWKGPLLTVGGVIATVLSFRMFRDESHTINEVFQAKPDAAPMGRDEKTALAGADSTMPLTVSSERVSPSETSQPSETRPITRSADANEFTVYLARVKKRATIAGIVGVAMGLCFSIAYLMQSDRHDIRGVIAAPFGFGFGLSMMVTGVALLLAPAAFFHSGRGKLYLQKIGTQNVAVARLVILMFLLLGCAVIAVVILGVMQMAGVIARPMHR